MKIDILLSCVSPFFYASSKYSFNTLALSRSLSLRALRDRWNFLLCLKIWKFNIHHTQPKHNTHTHTLDYAGLGGKKIKLQEVFRQKILVLGFCKLNVNAYKRNKRICTAPTRKDMI